MSKKLLAILLAVCMLVCLLPTMAMAEGEPVAKIGDQTYDTLAAAVAEGGNITLLRNVALSAPLVVSKDVTIDGADEYVISAADGFSGSNLIELATADKTLTFKDVTLDGNSKCRVIKASAGNLVLNNATVTEGKSSSYVGGVFITGAATISVSGGSIQGNICDQTSEYYQSHSKDLWIGSQASGTVGAVSNGAKLGEVFVNANSYGDGTHTGLTVNGAAIDCLYVEYDESKAAKVEFTSGTISKLYVSTTTNGTAVEVAAETGKTYIGGQIPVASVSLNESSKSLTIGDSFELTATVTPNTANDKTVTWTSSDEAVATVDENGKVTAKAAGTATITATAGGKTAICNVTVSNPPAPPVYVPTTPPAPVEPETPSVDTSAPVVDSTVTENADGSSTKTETLENGVVVETTTNTDGSTVTAATKTEETAQGTVTTTETAMSNGSKGTTTVDETGKVEAEVTVSAAAKSAAAAADAPVALPMPAVEASADSETAATVKVDLPAGTASATVAIPVAENTGAGTVAVIVNADGSETVITDSIVTENGLEVEVPDGATIKVVDNSTAFTDVPVSSWAKNAVDFASARSIMQGTSTGENATFAPNTATTRAMVWTMLARLSGADTAPGEGQTWYDKGQEWAMANGISDGTNANGEITREQLASMLHRYVGKPESNQDLSKFNDHEQTSDWAQTAKQWAVEMGVIGGKGNADGSLSLDPTGDASRAEVAQMLMNFIKAMSKKG